MMDNLFTIRLAKQKDAKKLANFCEQRMLVDNEPVSPEKLLPGVTAPIKDLSKGMYFIANVKDSDVPIACLMITYEWDSGNNAFIWWIQDVFVDEKWRRKGVYQSMHKHVVNTARERGNVFSIKLHVNHNNLKAQKTYQKMGMTNTPNYMYELPL